MLQYKRKQKTKTGGEQKMKYICKEKFEVNGTIVGNAGDILEITDAVPVGTETAESVAGYCDISNETTGKKYEACWMDIEDTVVPV